MNVIVDFPADAYARHVRTTVRWLLGRKPHNVNRAFRTAHNRFVAQLVHGGARPDEARERAREFARDVADQFAARRSIREHRPTCAVINISTRRRAGRGDTTTAIGGAA